MYGQQQKSGGILGMVALFGVLNYIAIPALNYKSVPFLDKLNLPSISALAAKAPVAAAVRQAAPIIDASVAGVYTDHARYTAGQAAQEESVEQELIQIPEDPTDNPYVDSKIYSASAQDKINGY